MKYKALLFDLDGTLADTSEGVYASARFAEEKLGLKKIDEKLLKKFIGPPLQYTYANEYGLSDEDVIRAVAAFREFYNDKGVFMCTPYKGLDELLRDLRNAGYKIGTATYKQQDFAKALLKRKFTFEFDTVRGSDNNATMTKSEISALAAKDMGATLSETVLVGDSKFDAEGAEGLHMDFIAVTYGFGFESSADAEIYPHVGICSDVEELRKLLLG